MSRSSIMRIDRAIFLSRLEQIEPGLSVTEMIEQSSCFAFSKGRVFTFNEEIACSVRSGLPKDFKAAVQATPLLKILRRLPDKKLDLSGGDKMLVIRGKKKQTRVRMESEFLLPVEEVETPVKWKKFPKLFTDAINIVSECAGKNEKSLFVHVHVTPKFMEACDNDQMIRYRFKTRVRKPILVRADSLKHVPNLDLSYLSETRSWMHFKGTSGLIMSCRRFVEEEEGFKDLSPMLKSRGSPTVLPKSLIPALKNAAIFSEEDKANPSVLIRLKPGRVKVEGVGESGDHKEWKKMRYEGKPIAFLIPPKLLIEIITRHADCEITKDYHLVVNGGRFTYCASLEMPSKKDPMKPQNKKEEDDE